MVATRALVVDGLSFFVMNILHDDFPPWVVASNSASFAFADLPMKPIASSSTTHLTHALCLVSDPENVPDLEALRSAMLDGIEKPMGFKKYDLLPRHDAQHVILPDGSLLSHIQFGTRIQTTRLVSIMKGDRCLLHRSEVTHPAKDKARSGRRHRPAVERTPAEIDAGFAYINLHAPTGFQRNQHLSWIEKELRSVDSPIHDWDRALVREAVRNKQTARGLADEIQSYPVCLEWVRSKVLKCLLPLTSSAAYIFLGKSGCGKTPLAMALSECQIQSMGLDAVPAFRTANNLDFFRGEPGERHVPFVCNEVSKEDSEAVKAFRDAFGVDPKLKA
eukprot:4682589-Amphidinium_carterae.1